MIEWDNLLDRYNAHKLMYSLQVVESLSRPLRRRKRSVVFIILVSTMRTPMLFLVFFTGF